MDYFPEPKLEKFIITLLFIGAVLGIVFSVLIYTTIKWIGG